MELESKLVPILREGVDVVKMILFKKLKSAMAEKHPELDPTSINRLSGAIINDLFGNPSQEEPFKSFAEQNEALIDKELNNIAAEFSEMRIPLTDALRVSFLCDHQDGIDSSAILNRANDLGILVVDREVPLPAKFLTLVRRLGDAFDLITSPPVDPAAPDLN